MTRRGFIGGLMASAAIAPLATAAAYAGTIVVNYACPLSAPPPLFAADGWEIISARDGRCHLRKRVRTVNGIATFEAPRVYRVPS